MALTERPKSETPLQTDPLGVGRDKPEASAIAAGGMRGVQLLARDARVAFLLINYARLRALARLFGIGPEQANLLTAIALWTLAETVRRKVRALVTAPGVPTADDTLLGGAVLRELLGDLAGPPIRDNPQAATLLTLAAVGGLAGPTVIRSIRSVKAGARRSDVAFRHRYGYLVDPGHWRRRRAQRGVAKRSGAANR